MCTMAAKWQVPAHITMTRRTWLQTSRLPSYHLIQHFPGCPCRRVQDHAALNSADTQLWSALLQGTSIMIQHAHGTRKGRRCR
jgi:hypothetical protein